MYQQPSMNRQPFGYGMQSPFGYGMTSIYQNRSPFNSMSQQIQGPRQTIRQATPLPSRAGDEPINYAYSGDSNPYQPSSDYKRERQESIDYANNFTADDLYGFTARQIRDSAQNRDAFELTDDQLDAYFNSLSPRAQDSWNTYKPKPSAFDSIRQKHGLGGSNPLWDYENNTLNRQEVARQGLRNRLAEYERNNKMLQFGLR